MALSSDQQQTLNLILNIEAQGQAILSQIDGQLKTMGVSLKSVDDAMGRTSASAASMDSSLQTISGSVIGVDTSIKAFASNVTASFASLEGAVVTSSESIIAMLSAVEQRSIEAASAGASENDVLVASYRAQAAASNTATAQISADSKAQIAAHQENMLAMRNEAAEAASAASKEVAANDAIIASLKSTRDSVLEVSASMKTMAGSGLSTLLGTLSTGMASLYGNAKLAAEAFALVGAAVGGVAIDAASKFQSEMNKVQGNTTLTDQDMKQLSASVKQLAADTNASIPTLTEGLMHVANFGYTGADAMNILSEANKSAAATGASVSDTANILANVMHEFGINTGQAAETMNVLHLAAAQGNMTLEQFDKAAGRVFAQAANLGVSLTDASAAMSALTRHGYDASQAGTQVANVMSHIVQPSKGAEKAIQDLSKASGVDLVKDFSAAGLSSKDLSGVFNDLGIALAKTASSDKEAVATLSKTEVFADLQKSLEGAGYSASQAAGEVYKLIPAMRGGQGAIALTGTAAGDFNTILGSLNDTMAGKTDPTSKAFANTTQTLSFQMGELKNRVDLAAISLGDVFLHSTTNAVSSLNNFTSSIGAHLTIMSYWEERTHTVENVLSGIGAVLSSVEPELKGWATDVLSNVEAFAQWGEKTGVFTAAVNIAGGAIEAYGTYIRNLLNDVEPVIAAFADWENHTHSVETVLGDFGSAAAQVFGTLINNIVPIVQEFIQWEAQTHALSTAANILSAVINAVAEVIGAIVLAIQPVITNFINWENQTKTIEKILSGISQEVAVFVSALGKVAQAVAPVIAATLQWLAESDNLKAALIAVSVVIAAAVTPAILSATIAAAPWLLAIAAITGAVLVVIESFKHWGDDSNTMVNVIRAGMDRLANGFITVVNLIIDAVNGFLHVVDFFGQVFGKHYDDIQKLNYVSMDYVHVTDSATQSTNDFSAAVSNASKALQDTGNNTSFLTNGLDAIKSKLEDTKSGTTDLTQSFDTMTSMTLQGVTQWASDLDGALQQSDAQLAAHGEKGSQLYVDAFTQNEPLIKQVVTQLASAGIAGAAGIEPEYQQHGQLAGHNYIVGLELNYAATKDATLRQALNAIEGLKTNLGVFATTGLVSAQNYVNGIMSQLGLATAAGTGMKDGVISGAEGVIPVMGQLGAAARNAFIAGLQGSGGGGEFGFKGAGSKGFISEAKDSLSQYDSSIINNGGVTQTYQSQAVLDAIKKGTDAFNQAVQQQKDSQNKNNTNSGGTPPQQGSSPGKSGGGGKGGSTTAAKDPVAEAIKTAEEMGKAADALEKARGYQRISTQSVDAIVADITYVNDQFKAVAAKYSTETNASISLYAETTAKVGDAISKVADGFTKIRGYISVGKSVMDGFFGDVVYITSAFGAAGKSYGTEMMSWAAEYATTTVAVGGAIDKMASGLLKLKDYASVGKSSMDAFVSDTSYLVGKFVDQGRNYTGDMEAWATKFADTTVKVGDAVDKMATGLTKLKGYASIGRASMDAFVYDTAYLVGKFVDQGRGYSNDMIKAAENFADVTDKVGSSIDKMVTGLEKIRNYAQVGVNAIENFVADTRRMISHFVDGGNEYDAQMQDRAQAFAKTTEVVGTAIDKMATGLKLLRDYSQIGFDAIENFVADTRRIISHFVDGGNEYDAKMQAQATSFATTTGIVGDAIGKMAAGLAKLKDYSQIGYDKIKAFTDDLGVAVSLFQTEGAKYDKSMRDNASSYATTATAVVDTIDKGATAFAKLHDYASIPGQNLINFFNDVKSAVSQAAQVATDLKQSMLDSAKAFGDSLKSTFDTISAAVTALTALRTYSPIPASVMKQFADDMEEMVKQVARINGDFLPGVLDGANEFGTKAKAIFDTLKTAIETFTGLSNFKGVAPGAIESLMADMYTAVEMVKTKLADGIAPDVLTAAVSFSTSCKNIFDNLDTAVKFFDGLSKIKDNPTNQLGELLTAMNNAITVAANDENAAQIILGHAASYAQKMAQAAADFNAGASAMGSANTAAQAAGQAAGSGGKLPQHAMGLDSVPYDGYVAALHKDEAILPSNVAEIYRNQKNLAQSNSSGGSSSSALSVANVASVPTSDSAATLDLISKVLDIADKMVKAISAINSAGDIAVTLLDKFIAETSAVVQRMVTAGQQFGKVALTAASDYSDAAVKASDAIIKGVDAFQALQNYKSIDISGITNLTTNITQLITAFSNAFIKAANSGKDIESGADLFADTAGKVLASVAAAVTSFTSLKNYSQIGEATIQAVFDDIHFIVTLMAYPLTDSITAALAGATAFATTVQAVGSALKPAIDSLVALSNYVSPSRSSIDRLFNDIYYIVLLMAYPLTDSITAALNGATAFANAAKTVVDVIKPAVDSFASLATYTSPLHSSIDRFFNDIWYMVSIFAYPLSNFIQNMLDGAIAFATAAKAVVDTVKTGVEAFGLLGSYSSPAHTSVLAFTNDVKYIVWLFSVQLTPQYQLLMNGATAFANAAKAIIDIIKTGVEGFTLLVSYSSVAHVNVLKFTDDVRYIVWLFSVQLTPQYQLFLDGATAFATAAKAVVDVIKTGVDGFAVLSTYVSPATANVQQFISDIKSIVEMLSQKLTQQEIDMLNGASTFATAAKAVVDIIKPGVDGFTALANYAGVPKASFELFFADLHSALIYMEAESSNFTTATAGVFSAFGDAVTKNMDGLVKAVDLFTKLQTLAYIPKAAFDSFFAVMQDTINRTIALENANAGVFTTAVTNFITSFGSLFDALKKALDLFGQLATQANTPANAIQHLFDDLTAALQGMAGLQSQAQLYYNGAASFASVMAAANQQLINGMSGGTAIGNSTTPLLPGGILFGGGGGTAPTGNNTQNVAGDTYNIYITGGTTSDMRDMDSLAAKIAEKVIETKQRRSTTIGTALGRP